MKRWAAVLSCCMAVLLVTAFAASAQDAPLGDDEYTSLIYGDGVLALLYPTGWTVDDSSAAAASTLVFFSSDSMLGRPADAPYAPGEASLALSLIPTEDLARYGLPSDSLDEALNGIVRSLRASQTDETGANHLTTGVAYLYPASDIQPELARAPFSLPETVDGELYLWRVADDLWALLTVSAAPGELADLAISAQVMLQSVEFDSTVEALRSGAADQGGAS